MEKPEKFVQFFNFNEKKMKIGNDSDNDQNNCGMKKKMNIILSVVNLFALLFAFIVSFDFILCTQYVPHTERA